jgi:hypothetical protein
MRFFGKVLLVVISSVGLGIMIGILPSVVVSHTRAQPAPKKAPVPNKVTTTAVGASCRNVRFESLGPGGLSLRGTFRLGVSPYLNRTIALFLVVDQLGANNTRKTVMRKELGRLKIPKGTEVPDVAFNEVVKLPPGTYRAAAFCRRWLPTVKEPVLDSVTWGNDVYTTGHSDTVRIRDTSIVK